MRVTTVVIDGNALKKEFEKKYIPLSVASETIGFEKSYIHKATRLNKMAKSAMKLIHVTYGIDPEIYLIKDEPKVEQQIVEVVRTSFTEEDQRLLYKIIYSATYEAMRRALNE